MTSAMHLSESNEAYATRDVVEAARSTLGTIDLDPASCDVANTVVRADVFFSLDKHVDGLRLPWSGRVFCNPPGGKTGKESTTKLWWQHGVEEWLSGRVETMIWIAFKLDFLQVTQGCGPDGPTCPMPLDFPICYPSSRLAYLTPNLPGPTDKNPNRKPTARQRVDHAATGLCTGDSPPHASAIIFLPGHDVMTDVNSFKLNFASIGEVVFDADRLPMRRTCALAEAA